MSEFAGGWFAGVQGCQRRRPPRVACSARFLLLLPYAPLELHPFGRSPDMRLMRPVAVLASPGVGQTGA